MPKLEARYLSRTAIEVVEHLAGVELASHLADEDSARYGGKLAQELDIPTGTLYPLLAKLERQGWLVAAVEQIDASQAGRPPRTYYKLTKDGRVATLALLLEKIRRLSPQDLVVSFEETAAAALRQEISQVRFRDDPHFYNC